MKGDEVTAANAGVLCGKLAQMANGAVYTDDGATLHIIARWNRGEIPVAFIHPASAGHGLNLQSGGSTLVLWFVRPHMELGTLPTDRSATLSAGTKCKDRGSAAYHCRGHD